MSHGQIDKMEAAGQKDLAIDPERCADDGRSGVNAATHDQQQHDRRKRNRNYWTQSNNIQRRRWNWCRPLTKPANLTDEQFIAAKNQMQALAYSGLGLVAFRRGTIAPKPYRIWSKSTEIRSESRSGQLFCSWAFLTRRLRISMTQISAFTKCAAIQSSLQATCKSGNRRSEEAEQRRN